MSSSSSSSSSSSGSDDDSVQSASVGEKRKMDTSSSSTSKPSSASIKVKVAANNPEYDPLLYHSTRNPTSIADEDSNATPPTFTYSKFKESSSRGRRIKGEDDHCAYSAAASGRGHDGRLSKTYVCIFDKKKNTLKLVPSAEKGTVFALDQSVKEYSPAVANENSTMGGEDNTISASDRVKMLVDSFGSKKKQKVMDSRAANKVNVHSVVGGGNFVPENVKDSAANVDSQEVSYEQARRDFLPPFDADADAPQKVYNAQALMGEAAWNKVSGIVNRRLRDLKEQGGDSGETICEMLVGKGHCPKSIKVLMRDIKPSATGSPYRFKVAFFLYLIMRFYNKIDRRGFLRGKTVDDCINECTFHMRLESEFLIVHHPIEGKEDGFLLSKQLKTKMYVYCLILFIIASSKDMAVPDITPLYKDLRLDDKQAAMILREAGFLVKKSKKGEIGVTLSTPLVFPPPRRGKRS
ncbi:DNA-directed RNA polymerase I subunit RPA49 [Skeletonema marinoi]|uniref:DNA-directed RNA polymerase I subunit RPA49 n=1 Tax=Skeletonema marinoi TaxID=267567 RepID=A0AAD8YLV2_9STRA|nr:DNA-directed RNA polymerase I subunit RPA49 [Skeletonema marinoi]